MKFQMLQILQQKYRMIKEQHLSVVEEFCFPIKFSHTKILCAKHFIAPLDYWKKKTSIKVLRQKEIATKMSCCQSWL